MTIARYAVAAFLPMFIAACAAPRQSAPVVDRTVGRTAEMPRPTAQQGGPVRQLENRAYYTVRKGDTLLQIALDFGQNYRDLVLWNNLANPNDIKIDQVLRVVPPDGAPQTGSVATSSGIETRPLNGAAAAPGTTNKTSPRGEKRPYSDATLAELQKPDSVATPAPVPKAEQRPAEKPMETPQAVVPDDEKIVWAWPAEGRIISTFGDGRRGIDIAGKLGQPVLAAGAGKVLYAGSGIRGYGNLVIVKHSNNLLSAYAHNKTIFVKEDQTVSRGQKIAEMGNSDSDEVKLHFEIRHQGKPVDPTRFLPSR